MREGCCGCSQAERRAMIPGRESSDPWSRKAHHILDQAMTGRGLDHHIEWALAYLGDTDKGAKIPRDLMVGSKQLERWGRLWQ